MAAAEEKTNPDAAADSPAISGAPSFLDSISGGADNLVANPPPVVDVEALEKTAPPDPPADPPGGLSMLGNLDNVATTAAVNDAKTSPAAKNEAAKEIVVVPAKKEYQAPSFTDQEMFDALCKSLFMVIREEISSTKSVVFTPSCSIAEGADGTLIVHNDFSKAKSYIVSTSLEDWTFDKVTKGQNKETTSIVFENDENKLQSFVIINDPSLNFYNSTTLQGLKIEGQFVVSSTEKAPEKEKMIEEYKSFIDLSNTLIKIQQSQELGKQVAIQEQIQLQFFTNQTKGEAARQGVYNKAVTRPHLEEIQQADATKLQHVGFPLTFDFRERIQEIEYFTFEEYIMDVGSFLAIFSFIFYVVLSPVSFLFVYSFITAIIKLIMKKYTEAEHMNLIEKMLKKFKLIQEALEEQKDDP